MVKIAVLSFGKLTISPVLYSPSPTIIGEISPAKLFIFMPNPPFVKSKLFILTELVSSASASFIIIKLLPLSSLRLLSFILAK